MIASLAIIILALVWLAYETDRLRVRLLAGPPALPVLYLAPELEVSEPYAVGWLKVYAGMTYKRNRNGGGRMVTLYDEVKLYHDAGRVVDVRCPRCQDPYNSAKRDRIVFVPIRTYTETVGNSTVTFTVCDDCLPKLRAEIERSQCAKPSKPPDPPRASSVGLSKGDGEITVMLDGELIGDVHTWDKSGTVKALVKAHS